MFVVNRFSELLNCGKLCPIVSRDKVADRTVTRKTITRVKNKQLIGHSKVFSVTLFLVMIPKSHTAVYIFGSHHRS